MKKEVRKMLAPIAWLIPGAALSLGISSVVNADITFSDIAGNPSTGITYRRAESPSDAIWDAMKLAGVVRFIEDGPNVPMKSRGAPGVAILDFDGDGDLDIYVTNGPGVANSLYENRYNDEGSVTFVDSSIAAGVDLTAQDNTGVCFGDIDNDGDQDLYVLALGEPNTLLENNGDGTFTNITDESDAGAGSHYPSSCAMGDVNNDSLLDIYVGNTFDNWSHRRPINKFAFLDLVETNQLLLNKGDNEFLDVSEESGVQSFAGITWAVSLVDYDLDGDVDIFTGDDQGAKAPNGFGGFDHGYLRVFENDGEGSFSDVTELVGTNRYGAWMGLSFGDFDGNGNMDVFGTNSGNYLITLMSATGQSMDTITPTEPMPFPLDAWASSWFLGQAGGGFTFPGQGDLGLTPFGWGTSAIDYDNDGDTDITFHGGMDMVAFIDASNPGVLLNNDGSANFSRDTQALLSSTNHSRRGVQGLATGDLNSDGFPDIVTVSNQNWPEPLPLLPYLPEPLQTGGPFDATSFIWPTMAPVDPADPSQGFVWTGIDPVDGTLSVELNSGDNGNGWMKVTLVGSAGITHHGKSNRDGIGAVVRLTLPGSGTAMQPVQGGSSYASQNSLQLNFGMADHKHAQLDVIWPGGTRNRLYGVNPGEHIRFPEIPCNFENDSISVRKYMKCVSRSLKKLRHNGVISSKKEANRFRISALMARLSTQAARH